ncbi:bacteriohemerythrin [Motiliproteus sp. MSK22-1]|uniref:bacteriohemerythrin n=1 Tax=Motiliproteus sp. MSK22-1 TaxID=1897630 RepID=UPI001300FA89|nr:bacteriohemerythrin [Motiliproteus sp. MSK22-1]
MHTVVNSSTGIKKTGALSILYVDMSEKISDTGIDQLKAGNRIKNKALLRLIAESRLRALPLGSVLSSGANQHDKDALLLDLQENPQQGLEVMRELYQMLPNSPILVLTEDDNVAHQALRLGAQAHLTQSDLKNEKYLRTLLEDAQDRKNFEQLIAHSNHYDHLTGLVNREGFLQQLQQALLQSKMHNSLVSLLFVDIHNFKLISSTLTMELTDQLLAKTSQRIRDCLTNSDLLAHTGGNEFAIITQNSEDINNVTLIAENLLQVFSSPVLINRQEIYLDLKIGISVGYGGEENAVMLLQETNMALHKAQQAPGSQVEYYTPEIAAAAQVQLQLLSSLRKAQENKEMFLVYQPQVDINTGRVLGAESLLRWQHPRLGLVPPTQFVPILEQIGMIHKVGAWVIREACHQRRLWAEMGLLEPEATIAVNLSMRQFSDPQLIPIIEAAIEKEKIQPNQLDLELTESLLMEDIDGGVDKLNRLKSLGVKLSLDDFGTGYSSLSYLKQFPLDVLKVDRTFISNLTKDTRDEAIVRAIISLAHNLGFEVIAEGVETKEQLQVLQREGCESIQGFYISKPLSPTEFLLFLKKSAIEKQLLFTDVSSGSMLVGDPTIDAQHKHLLSLIDCLAQNVKDEANLDKSIEAIEELLSYIEFHFETEEQLMKKLNFSDLKQHSAEHLQIKHHIRRIRDKTRAGETVLNTELVSILKDWITDHIVHSDMNHAEPSPWRKTV